MSIISRDIIVWPGQQVSSAGTSSTTRKKDKIKKREMHPVLNLDDQLLNQFFPPVPDRSFIRDFFQRNVVVSRGFDLSQVTNNLFDLDVKKMITETASDQIHVWLKTSGPGDKSDIQVLDSISIDDPEQAYKLYQAGHSLYCRASAEFESLVVIKLANELQYGIRNVFHSDRFRRGEVEMFFSRANHFTDFHSDFQENFTMQLSGSKRWIFQESKATHPLRGCTPHFNLSGNNSDVAEQQVKVLRLGNPTFSTVDYRSSENINHPHTSVTLHPGDIMYHPAGVWHRVECLEDSISINISLTAVSYADVFCGALQQMLSENPRWRSAVFPATNIGGDGYKESALAVMSTLLSNVPNMVAALNAHDILTLPMLRDNLPQINGKSVDADDEGAGEAIDESASEEDPDEEENSNEYVEVDEEDSDSDDGNEGNGRKRLQIVIPEVDIDQSLALYKESTSIYSSAEVVMESNRKRKGNLQEFEAAEFTKFKFNPAALLITDEDLSSLSVPNKNYQIDEAAISISYRKYIVNIGFGNETLESACRTEIVVTPQYQAWMNIIVTRYNLFHLKKHEILVESNQLSSTKPLPSTTWISASFSAHDLITTTNNRATTSSEIHPTKRKKTAPLKPSASEETSPQECVRLLFGLYQAGLLTPI